MEKVLWAITLSASLIFIIQSVLTFIGASGDFDADASGLDGADGLDGIDAGTGMNLLTFRNLVNFLLGFGWTAILLKEKIQSTAVLMLVSIIVGVILVILVMLLFKWLSGMQQSGNIDVFKSAVGCEGQSYLPIPASRAGTGKVQITINGAVREYDALTDSPEDIATGAAIKVVEVLNPTTLLVNKI